MTSESSEPKLTLKTHYPCNVCGKVSIGRLSPDLDVKGFCFCKKHEDEVYMAYVMLISGSDEVESAMKDWKFK